MHLLTELGLISAAHDLERRLEQGELQTPHHLVDGTSMFVWSGKADGVELRTWMPSFPPPPPFQRLPGSDLWVLQVRLPATSMIEYRIAIERGGRHSEIVDPLNPATTTNPFGVNSVAAGPEYSRPAWSYPDAAAATGSIGEIRVQSHVWGERRHHLVYLPPNHDRTQPHPLVIVHDGSDFVDHSLLNVALDNLIGTGQIPPVVALLHNPRHRLEEYAHDPRHATHVVDELIPHVARRTALADRTVLVGSSLGAVAALSVAWLRREAVSGLGLLSGSFAARASEDRPPAIFAPVVDLVTSVDSDDRLAGADIYMSCGRYEGLIDLNRALAPRLRFAGANVRYEETWEGHQWASWRDRLGPALTHTLG